MNNIITNQQTTTDTVATVTAGNEHSIEELLEAGNDGKPVFDTDSFVYGRK